MDELRLPGMLVRFRPTGPWRIGPDSGARDRVDHILHSDVLFSAICAAMDQIGLLPEWLQATAQAEGEPAVRLSSCFPWQEDELFVVPPRNLWPPPPSAKVRWAGARFIPLSLVQLLLSEKTVDEERWAVDPVSDCLLPAQRRFAGGPFRIAVRSSAAIDRVTTGRTDVHATACLEFAERAGMWCAIAFADDQARTRWAGPVKSALRLLADSGLGGERSRGWGRSLSPSITEGNIPALLLPKLAGPKPKGPVQNEPNPSDVSPETGAAASPAQPESEPTARQTAPGTPLEGASDQPPAEPEIEPTAVESAPEQPPAESEIEPTPVQTAPQPVAETTPGPPPAQPEIEPIPVQSAPQPVAETAPEPPPAEPEIEPIPVQTAPQPVVETTPEPPPAEPKIEPIPVETAPQPVAETTPEPPPAEPEIEPTVAVAFVEGPAVEEPLRLESGPIAEARPVEPQIQATPAPPPAPQAALRPQPEPPAPSVTAWWLLSLFSPAPTDTVDWSRGNYTALTRSGRIESAARWGDLKKSVRMLGEGSVVIAASQPCGAAPDVAPEGFPHPVFRSGFAFAIPIPWRLSS